MTNGAAIRTAPIPVTILNFDDQVFTDSATRDIETSLLEDGFIISSPGNMNVFGTLSPNYAGDAAIFGSSGVFITIKADDGGLFDLFSIVASETSPGVSSIIPITGIWF